MIRFSEVLGNAQKLDGGSMFGNAPRTVWEKWAPADELGRIDLACRTLLVEIDNVRILFETGIGVFFEPKMAERFGVQTPDTHQLLKSLENLGHKESDIDWVILSHLHFDHAGGLLPTYKEIESGNNNLVFSKAQFVVGFDAFERAEHPHFRDRASFIPHLTEKLKASGRLHLIKEGQESPIFPDHIEFTFTHGHTPGHMHSLITGSNSKIFFAGDLIPGTPWVHLPITMGYDRFPEKLIDEKKHIYQRALAEKWEIFYTHDPKVACSQIEQDAKGKFVPVNKISSPKKLVF
ncbi:MAG: MBL fold metallo-hydrolase [Bdellovibrionales bacterium]|nr:MBL fold metallo-hydrolase [Bdellovibrionales bacterium]